MADANVSLKIRRSHLTALRELLRSLGESLCVYEEEVYGEPEPGEPTGPIREVTIEQAKAAGWPIEEVTVPETADWPIDDELAHQGLDR